MFELKEFITQVMHDDIFQFKEELLKKDELDSFFAKEIRKVTNDYAQNPDYGVYTGDSENARDHLFSILKDVYVTRNNFDQRGNVEADLKNWLTCIDIYEYDDTLPKVLIIMVYLGYADIVYEQMEKEYQRFNESRNDPIMREAWKPAYFVHYMKIGDYFLFSKGNIAYTIKFYHLARSDWYGLFTENVYMEEITKEKKNELEKIFKNVLILDKINNLLPIEISTVPYCSKETIEFYNQYVRRKSRRRLLPKELLEVLLDFIISRKKYFDNSVKKGKSIEEKRILFFISHRLFEDSLEDIIAALGIEKIDLKSKERILNCLCMSERKRLTSISRLVIQYRNEPDILKVLSLLMQSSLQIKEVLSILKVSELKAPISYYTSLSTFCYMLPDWNKLDDKGIGRFSVMGISYMNDPNEGKTLQDFLQQTDESSQWNKYITNSETARKKIDYPFVFMRCFTQLVDDLPMWEMYGDGAKGCCIVFDTKTFQNINESELDNALYHTCYIGDDGKSLCIKEEDNTGIADVYSLEDALVEIREVGKCLFEKTNTNNELYKKACVEFMNMLNQIRYLFKSAAYKHEKEVRLLYVYPQIDNAFLHTKEKWPKLYVRPDFPVRIKEIIFGPKCTSTNRFMLYLQEQIIKMCKKDNSDIPMITMSNIHYQ